MNKKQLTEADIRTKFILPAIEKAGWDRDKQIREEKYFTDGRIYIYGATTKRGIPKKADYVLYYKNNIPIVVIEAKDNKHSVGAGLQQAIDYAEVLDIPFAFSSNGDGFVFQDLETGENNELSLEKFPTSRELWEKYKKYKGITEKIEDLITADYYFEKDWKHPRYYQRIAINRTVEAIAKGKNRILLVMATGTGKTYTAFQIIWRLREKWRPKGQTPRVLYLADRNVLVDDPMNKDLKPLKNKGVLTKVRKRKADKSYEVYMALYQGISGTDESKNIYKQFSKDFFDLIIVDECHRGSAKANSAWREVLKHFSDAVQIGMTATPKETTDVSNIDYFGDPVYKYSLKQGIEDGFLAPYRVIKVAIDKDVHGYRPKKGEKDKYGEEIPDEIYTNREFDRSLVIDERTKVVAEKVSEFLKNTNRMDKTIVFCVDIEHAVRMTAALRNENKDLWTKNKKYIMRITGDNDIGKRQLDNFMDPASKHPVIVTTSKLMTTGIDVQTCKLIVLDSPIQSMTEFKQIIGRGTRIREDYNKTHFTIIDFRNVTDKFADPDFDGEPVQVMEYRGDQEIDPEEIKEKEVLELQGKPDINIYDIEEKPRKFYVKEADVSVLSQSEQYLDASGKLITEKLIDYTKKSVKKDYRTLNDFLQKWNVIDQKRVLIEELQQKGIIFDCLRETIPNGKEYDPFDLILHVAYGKKPLTRSERAKKVNKDSYFDKYGGKAREVISALLDKYSDEGIENLEDAEVLRVEPLNKFGRPLEIMKLFGGAKGYQKMIREVEKRIYKS
ncbi:MAG: DEAD/DEAH box helicase family protein [archaeon]